MVQSTRFENVSSLLQSLQVQPQPCPPLPLLSSSAVDWTHSIRARQHFLSARKKRALCARVYVREMSRCGKFMFARCHDAASLCSRDVTVVLRAKRYTARTRPDSQHLQQEVRNRNLQQLGIAWSGRYKNGGVLCAGRPWRDGRRL